MFGYFWGSDEDDEGVIIVMFLADVPVIVEISALSLDDDDDDNDGKNRISLIQK